MRFFLARNVWLLLLPGAWPAAGTAFYVDLNSTNPTPPYANWSTAAVNLQDAVGLASSGDVVWVQDGWYQNGFALSNNYPGLPKNETNRIVLAEPIRVQSVNGSSAAFISGNNFCRCAYVGSGAVLSGFTLIGGRAGYLTTQSGNLTSTVVGNGAGVSGTYGGGGIVTNCVLENCQATGGGGAAYEVTLLGCILASNQATNGGGAAASFLVNCRVIGNQAPYSPPAKGTPFVNSYGEWGGIMGGWAVNCLIAGNSAWAGGAAITSPW